MKRKFTIAFKTCLFTITLSAINFYAQAGGIADAGKEFATEASSLKKSMQAGLLGLAFVCAAIGLVSVLSKSNVENENASKHYIKWFTGAGLFALAWGLMSTFFG